MLELHPCCTEIVTPPSRRYLHLEVDLPIATLHGDCRDWSRSPAVEDSVG